MKKCWQNDRNFRKIRTILIGQQKFLKKLLFFAKLNFYKCIKDV